MGLSSDLISQFVKATNDKSEPVKEAIVYGTTVVYGEDIYVKLDGSELLTPVDTTSNVVDGERVTVMIKNHTATITGNITSPSARGKDVEMSVNSLNIKIDGVGTVANSAQSTANDAQSTANAAQNTANSAQSTANSAQSSASNAQSTANSAANAASNAVSAANDAKRYATDYLKLSNDGLEIGANSLNTNVLVSPNAINFRRGSTILASYQSDYIYLGKANNKATIDLADGVAKFYNESDDDAHSRLVIEADASIKLSSQFGEYHNVMCDRNGKIGEAHITMETLESWYPTYNTASSKIELHSRLSDSVITYDSEECNAYAIFNALEKTITLQVYGYSEMYAGEYDTQLVIKPNNITLRSGVMNLIGDTYITDGGNLIFGNCNTIYGLDTSGSVVEAFCAQSASNNVTVGYGVYENASGNTNVYGNNINLYTKNNVYVRGGEIMLANGMGINGANTSGTYRQLITYNGNNNTVIGHGGYSSGVGQTNLYGNKVYIGVKTAGEIYKPYYEAGDSISLEWYGAGYITSSSARIYFVIPLSKPVIGSPSVSVSSVDGLQIRQVGAAHTDSKNVGVYVYGSDKSSYAKPSSYSTALAANGNYVHVVAVMGNTTNALNNTPCGISASIKITFS